MRFTDREEAADLLAAQLTKYRDEHPVVLGVPRGGVPMARIIADVLDADLDVVLVRKLRAPQQPELAIGAIDEAGTVLKGRYFDLLSDDRLREEMRAQREIIRQRRTLYAKAHASIDLTGRVVIVVDDGVATGSSMLAAIRSVRAHQPRKVIVAIGVAPPASLKAMQAEADEVVCLYSTDDFYAVGQFFDDFSEVTDEMVIEALSRVPAAAGAPPAKG